jgi:hypothetical protein
MLTCTLFADDALLESIADDQDRISRTRHRRDPAMRKVQIALLDRDPNCLTQFGADGDYGDETAGAVARFRIEVLGVPPAEVIDDVGPLTVRKLGELQAAAERPPAPSVTPEEWLLTETELGPFRSPAFTRDNVVDFFVDAEGYYNLLADRLDALLAGDRVLFAGWRFSPEQLLRPTVAGSPGILDRLRKLRADGIAVRALLYGSHFSTLPVRRPRVPTLPSKDNFDFRTGLVEAGAEAILDARVGDFGSLHQKCAVVQGAAEGPCAFLGGIDVCLDRWDNGAHVDPPVWQREPDFLGTKISLRGWHDVQCAVFGPAVGQIWQSLVERWNDPTRPSRIDATPAPIPQSEAPGPPTRSGTQAVQVLRTLTCKGVYSFLTGGEFTVTAAYRKALHRARRGTTSTSRTSTCGPLPSSMICETPQAGASSSSWSPPATSTRRAQGRPRGTAHGGAPAHRLGRPGECPLLPSGAGGELGADLRPREADESWTTSTSPRAAPI